jgi:hypothetical protein
MKPAAPTRTVTFAEGSSFPSIQHAKDALLAYAIQEGFSFKVRKAESVRYLAVCRHATESSCPFRVRINWRKRRQEAIVSIFRPHTCSPVLHRDWKVMSSVKYLAPAHRETIVGSPGTVKARDIAEAEMRRGNLIAPKQAWRVLKAVQKDAAKAAGVDISEVAGPGCGGKKRGRKKKEMTATTTTTETDANMTTEQQGGDGLGDANGPPVDDNTDQDQGGDDMQLAMQLETEIRNHQDAQCA